MRDIAEPRGRSPSASAQSTSRGSVPSVTESTTVAPSTAAPFQIPATVLIGGGARRETAALLQRFGVRRGLLVTDAGMVQLGPAGEIAALLKDAGIAVTVFDSVQPDPTDRNVTGTTLYVDAGDHAIGM